ADAALAHYRNRFQPSEELARPHAMLAATVVCGQDDDHAMRLAAPLRLAVVRSRTGQRMPVASIEEALAYRFTPEEQAVANDFLEGAIIGGPQRVRDGLTRLAARSGADEIMVSGL